MKQLQLFLVLATAVLLASCNKKTGPEAMAFEVYEQKGEVTVPGNDGEWEQTLLLKIDVPTGDDEAQENVEKAILEIIGKSKVAYYLGAPTGSTIKEVGENYVNTLKNNFKERFLQLQKTEKMVSSNLVLTIRCVYQNEACVVMAVTDGGDRVGTDRIFESVIRLSDGHILTNEEIANISEEELLELACKYSDASQEKNVKIEGEYSLSIGPEGLLFHPSQYFETEYAIPISAVEPKLTEEAKALLAAKDVADGQRVQLTEPIKGDLALYDLCGPVKKLVIMNEWGPTTYTFDTEGRLTSETHEMNGKVVDDKMFYARTNRDDKGRGVERFGGDNITKEVNTFNQMGQLVKQEYWLGGRLDRMTVNYYDELGRRYKTNDKVTVHGNLYSNVTSKYNYSGYKYDEHGNWTECLGMDEKRVITYYEAGELTTEEPVAEPEPETVSYEPGRGDLGSHDLRGPVKKVSYKGGWAYTFNEQGQLLTENGQSLKSIFPGGIKRDKNGRLSECNADAYGSRYYTYNAKGLPTEIAEDGYVSVFTYDEEGYVKTETNTEAPEMGDEEGESTVTKHTYTILEKDNYGNWIKRKDQHGTIASRTITYY